jgi:hypothetical protein
MSLSSPLGAIEALEQRLFCVSEALKNGDVEDLVPSIAEFHALVIALVSAQGQSQNPPVATTMETALRWKQLGSTLGQVREQLVRRQGLVDQALKMVIPATHTPVYANQAGSYGTGGARSSGRLQVLTA